MNFFCRTEAFQASCQWNSRANYFFITPAPSNDPIFQNLAISILQDTLVYISSATCQESPESQLVVGKGKKLCMQCVEQITEGHWFNKKVLTASPQPTLSLPSASDKLPLHLHEA
jgi:hypothetical protein